MVTNIEKQIQELIDRAVQVKLERWVDGLIAAPAEGGIISTSLAAMRSELQALADQVGALRTELAQLHGTVAELKSAPAEPGVEPGVAEPERYAVENDGLLVALGKRLETTDVDDITTGTLFTQLSDIARTLSVPFPATARSFGMRLTAMVSNIEATLGARYSQRIANGNLRYVTIRKQRAPAVVAVPAAQEGDAADNHAQPGATPDKEEEPDPF
jgi:hypothetical protein